MGRLLAIAVFARAAGSAAVAGAGLSVAPHVDPPGTPRIHDHMLPAYRYSAFLIRFVNRTDGGPRVSIASDLRSERGLIIPGHCRAAPLLGPPRFGALLAT